MTKEVNKVVLGWKDGTGSIGVQALDCDPYFRVVGEEAIQLAQRLAAEREIPVELTPMDIILSIVPEALEEAQAHWGEAPQYPTYERPTLAQTAQPARARGRQAPAATPAEPKPPTETTPKLF